MLGAGFRWCSLILPFVLAIAVKFLVNPETDPKHQAVEYAQSSLAESYKATCAGIERSLSSASQVFYPGSGEFYAGIAHWTNSSSQLSACSVEPGTPHDVGVILRKVGLTRTPFAIKGGGHTLNPGFSSTRGVHVSLARFKDIVIHEDSETVEIGAGLTWAEVYAYLVPRGINVVGGRTASVGVSGLTLGGGYSWKTNRFGLTVDTVVEYQLVLPDGQVTVVTEKDEELWFALKGGLNNYGIVTRFTLKFHRQSDIWATLLVFSKDQIKNAHAAFAKFLTRKHDNKGAQVGQHAYANGALTFTIQLFYDGPEPPGGLYDDLLNLPNSSATHINGSFADFILRIFLPTHERKGYFDAISLLRITEPILNTFANETKFWGEKLSKHDKDLLVVYTSSPFEPDFLTHGGPSAYPPDRSRPILPVGTYFGWSNTSIDDAYMADAVRSSTAASIASGIRDGQDLENAARYSNYALFGTPLEEMYGGNVARLREIRRKYDRDGTMALAGGWKF